MAHRVQIIDKHSAMDTLLRNAKQLKGSFVKCGYPVGTRVDAPSRKGSGHDPFTNVSELATVAAAHEFGVKSRNIPKRAHIRPAIDKADSSGKLGKLQAKLIDAVFAGKLAVDKALEVLGEFLVSAIKREITLLQTPPLKKQTIKRKKSSKPLIDRAQMRNSVSYTRHTK